MGDVTRAVARDDLLPDCDKIAVTLNYLHGDPSVDLSIALPIFKVFGDLGLECGVHF